MMQKVYVNSENKAIFTCPSCAKARTVEVSKFLGAKANAKLKAKCPCGHSYPVLLERRKYYRKETKLPGVFRLDKNGKESPMTVTNVSRSGLQFRTSESKNLEMEDLVALEFRLDDKNKSMVKKKAIVKKIEGNMIGAEFCFLDDYDKVLGFYLFN